MIVAVSTVKDSRQRLERWVARNLANGVDHLVVFVDDADPDILGWLASTPHVTPVDCAAWWGGRRPDGLNVRQRINANAVRAIATVAPGADWVLHLDSDEVAVIDRAQLDALPPTVGAVRLAPCEAVSQREWPDGDVTSFKRLLSDAELALLLSLGGIGKATNNEFFHGHVGGKVAMRPVEELWIGTHHVVDAQREKQPTFDAPWLRLLHYESHTAEEFIRKWTNLVTSGPPVKTRGARSELASAIRGLVGLDLPADDRHELMLRLFDLHVRDDLDLLTRMGVLVHLDPDRGQHRPPSSPETVTALETHLRALTGVDKSCFEPGGDVAQARALLTPERRRFLPRRG